MDASSLQTPTSHRLCHSTKEGQTGCQSDKDCVVQTAGQITSCQQTQPVHLACMATTWQESAKETGCL